MIQVFPFVAPNETHPITKTEALSYCGKALNMCYLKDDFSEIEKEPLENSLKRANTCIASGHHSGFEHAKITLRIEGISKMMAMILNSQRKYATSEKSGRYTVLKIENERQEALRQKWQAIFEERIREQGEALLREYYVRQGLPEEKVQKKVAMDIRKKAQENSRNVTGILTAKTKMIFSMDMRQFSYLRYELKQFIQDNRYDTPFFRRLKEEMKEFLTCTEPYGLEEEGLTPAAKGITLPFFSPYKTREEEFGECYSMNEYVSASSFAQMMRHRTITYCVLDMLVGEKFYVPACIEAEESLVQEWIEDLKSVTTEDDFPQATMFLINERGTFENFIEKMEERLCGAAQLEIAMLSKHQLEKYWKNTTNPNAKEALSHINTGARCTFGYPCKAPCVFGPKYAFHRTF